MGSEKTLAGPAAPAFAGLHAPRPLPFDPARLPGLSERLLRSHWESNYGGAVKFRRTANALAGGSGWAILALGPEGDLHSYWAWDHANGAAGSTPLLVLDMYEHAYHLDYGAAARRDPRGAPGQAASPG